MDKNTEDLRTEINSLREENRKLVKKNNDLRKELETINNSNGMKVLKKYYKVRDCYKPIIFSLRKISHVINFDNGKKVYKTFRTQGLNETIRKINCHIGMNGECASKNLDLISTSAEIKNIDEYEEIIVPKFDKPKVSIIIPVYNQFEYTYNCILSIVRNCGLEIPYEIIVADDKSTDLTTHIEKKIINISVIHNEENLRFLKNCNNAAKYANGEYILFLNNDTQVQNEWLSSLVTLIESDSQIGMVGSKLIYPDGKLQEAGGIIFKDGSAWNYGHGSNPDLPEFNYVKEVDYISGASIMIRKNLWKQLGGFDELFVPAYYEDTDLAFMVRRAGYKVVYQPKSVVVHFEGISNGTDTSCGLKAYQTENSKKFFNKWKQILEEGHFKNGEKVFVARDRSCSKKHILVIDHYVPTYDKDAGSRCTWMYIELFVKLGMKVTFIGDNFFYNKYYADKLMQLGVEVLYGPYYKDNWRTWIKDNGKTLEYVYLNRPHISEKYIDFLKENTKCKIIYFGHDLHFLREYRQYELTKDVRCLTESNAWKKKEFDLFNKADVIYVVGNYEQEIVKKNFPHKIVRNIPVYFWDKVEKSGINNLQNKKDLLFVGGFNHWPNVDAIEWFVNEIFPSILRKYPQMKLYIVGSNPPEEIMNLANENIIVTGFVSDEQLDSYYNSCRLAVVPLRVGAGVKGKVIEAIYKGIPLITTPIGAEGLSVNENAFVIAEPNEFMSEVINNLYDDIDSLNRMVCNSEMFINRYFTEDYAKSIVLEDMSV